jgi:peptidyl-prolyl cis-trans isomerase A (cyclophilin A)
MIRKLLSCLTIIFASLLKINAECPIVECSTSKGPLKIEIYREWSPLGADRFLELVKDQFFTNIGLFRCVHNFLVQFGISEDPAKKHWHGESIKDDPNLHKRIKKHFLSYAGGGPNTRSTQLFIAFEDLDFLGKEPWETPFGMKNDFFLSKFFFFDYFIFYFFLILFSIY